MNKLTLKISCLFNGHKWDFGGDIKYIKGTLRVLYCKKCGKLAHKQVDFT